MIRVNSKYLLMPFAIATILFSQEMPLRSGPAGERLEQFKKVQLLEALKLDEETSVRFLARYQKHQDAIREINQKRNGLIDQLQTMSRSGSNDADVEKTIRDLIATETKVTEARNKFLSDLKEILSMKQIARLIAFERNFYRDIRDIVRDMAKERQDRMRRRLD
jgi:hypothetical protein